jgi:hypothetical protein
MPNIHDGYYKVVKLKTGENILCSMDRDIKSPASETHLHLNIPVQVVPMKEMRKGNHVVGESFMLRPWMGLSDGEEFTISTDIVLTIGDLKKEVKQQYVNYISQARETRQRIEDQEAAEDLLREVSNGELRIVEIDEYYGDDYGEEER